ncbi:hypothetical protein NMY22_g16148 [Coprinellus aureogranulatus]|nr:hypothetical protein NMY22_g16148 [Coprinellus aureogranulatus]
MPCPKTSLVPDGASFSFGWHPLAVPNSSLQNLSSQLPSLRSVLEASEFSSPFRNVEDGGFGQNFSDKTCFSSLCLRNTTASGFGIVTASFGSLVYSFRVPHIHQLRVPLQGGPTSVSRAQAHHAAPIQTLSRSPHSTWKPQINAIFRLLCGSPAWTWSNGAKEWMAKHMNARHAGKRTGEQHRNKWHPEVGLELTMTVGPGLGRRGVYKPGGGVVDWASHLQWSSAFPPLSIFLLALFSFIHSVLSLRWLRLFCYALSFVVLAVYDGWSFHFECLTVPSVLTRRRFLPLQSPTRQHCPRPSTPLVVETRPPHLAHLSTSRSRSLASVHLLPAFLILRLRTRTRVREWLPSTSQLLLRVAIVLGDTIEPDSFQARECTANKRLVSVGEVCETLATQCESSGLESLTDERITYSKGPYVTPFLPSKGGPKQMGYEPINLFILESRTQEPFPDLPSGPTQCILVFVFVAVRPDKATSQSSQSTKRHNESSSAYLGNKTAATLVCRSSTSPKTTGSFEGGRFQFEGHPWSNRSATDEAEVALHPSLAFPSTTVDLIRRRPRSMLASTPMRKVTRAGAMREAAKVGVGVGVRFDVEGDEFQFEGHPGRYFASISVLRNVRRLEGEPITRVALHPRRPSIPSFAPTTPPKANLYRIFVLLSLLPAISDRRSTYPMRESTPMPSLQQRRRPSVLIQRSRERPSRPTAFKAVPLAPSMLRARLGRQGAGTFDLRRPREMLTCADPSFTHPLVPLPDDYPPFESPRSWSSSRCSGSRKIATHRLLSDFKPSPTRRSSPFVLPSFVPSSSAELTNKRTFAFASGPSVECA